MLLALPTLSPDMFCQQKYQESEARKQFGTWFDSLVADTIDWDNVPMDSQQYQNFSKLEHHAYQELFAIHELPFSKPMLDMFSLNDLCRIVSPPDQHELWLEILEIISEQG